MGLKIEYLSHWIKDEKIYCGILREIEEFWKVSDKKHFIKSIKTVGGPEERLFRLKLIN